MSSIIYFFFVFVVTTHSSGSSLMPLATFWRRSVLVDLTADSRRRSRLSCHIVSHSSDSHSVTKGWRIPLCREGCWAALSASACRSFDNIPSSRSRRRKNSIWKWRDVRLSKSMFHVCGVCYTFSAPYLSQQFALTVMYVI